MKPVTMLFQAPVESLQLMIDDGLRLGHRFEYDGQILIVSYIGNSRTEGRTVPIGFEVHPAA
jgi:hypothetical protein